MCAEKFTKEDQGVKHILNLTLQTLEVTNGTWPGFTTSEVRAAISKINPSKVAGPYKVHPKLLHHLGPKAISFIQQLFNKSWESISIPQGWRLTDILPVPKNDKDPQKLESYHPISLTSSIGKVMECQMTKHLHCEAALRESGRLSEWMQHTSSSTQSARASNAAQ